MLVDYTDFIISEIWLPCDIVQTPRVSINAQVCILYAQKIKWMHSFLAKYIRKKVPKMLVCRQRTPEKQKEPPTLWNWGSQQCFQ